MTGSLLQIVSTDIKDIFLKNSKTKENNKENQLFGRGENNSRQK